MLKITKDLKKQSAIIASTDERFKGTALENTGFKIEVTELKAKDSTNLLFDYVGEDGKVLQGDYREALFVASITGVDGFVDELEQPIPLSKELCKNLFEYFPLIRSAVLETVKGFEEQAEKKSDLAESDSEPTPVGV